MRALVGKPNEFSAPLINIFSMDVLLGLMAIIVLGTLVISFGLTKERAKTGQGSRRVEKSSDHRKREYLTTANERKLFYALQRALNNDYLIHCQTSLIALVEPLHFKDRPRAWSRRVDFVITDKTSKILAVIELDDASHRHPKRIARDQYVNYALNNRHPLIRIATKNFYQPEQVAEALATHAGIPNKFAS